MTDTGPPYPPPPGAGDNGVGEFEVGVSQVGDYPQFSVWSTVVSQYANSPIIDALVTDMQAYFDQTQNLDAFYDYIWNVDTAEGLGLDIWGRIVGVERTIHVPDVSYFGFAEALPGSLSFNPLGGGLGGGTFYSGAPVTSNYDLADPAFRLLILAKAASNISNGSIPSINRILMNLFPGRGNAYVTDGYQGSPYFGFAESGNAAGFNQAPFYDGETIGSMQMTYTFKFQLSPVELAIVQGTGVLPKPTGVAASVVIT